MPPTIEEISAMDASCLRRNIPQWLADHVAFDESRLRGLRQAVDEALAAASDADLLKTRDRYSEVGEEYRLYPAVALARRIGRVFLAEVVAEWQVEGGARLREALDRGPCLAVCNHLSYADSQFTDHLLAAGSDAELAARLVFVAGPKVYTEPLRRMAAIGLNTLQTAQSGRLAQNEEALPPRQIARIAIATLREARSLGRGGQLPLLYAEGGRSRSGRLGSFLRGVARYPEPATLLVPFALSGTQRAFPMHQRKLHAAPIRLTIGGAVEVGDRDPAQALAEVWRRIAELLPEASRPAAGTPELR